MRQDKLTTKFQEALGEAQSLALAHDNQVIEPVHILAAVLADGEGSSRSLLERAGVNVQSLTREVNAAVERLPKVSGTGGDVQISRDLMNLLNLTEKEAMKRGDEFISTEMLLLALTEDRSEAGRLAKNAGLTRAAIEAAVETVRGGDKADNPDAESQREAMKKETDDASKKRLQAIEDEIDKLSREYADLEEVWKKEKSEALGAKSVRDEIDRTRHQMEEYRRTAQYEKLAELQYAVLPKLEERLKKAEKAEKAEAGDAPKPKLLRTTVGAEEIAEVVSRATGIPVAKMMEGERQKLLHMKDALEERVVGQDEAVKRVAETILRSRAGLSDPNRPYGSFLFLGPTGVGKTELTKALAQFLFDTEDALVRIDMSEFMEKHSVARLIGAPPGYVGYEEGGYLTEAVRRHPYSVILLDEVEKAHPDVFNVLLQVLDDGRMTDGQGRTVDFKNTVIVMTSNLGSSEIQEMIGESRESVKNAVMTEVREHFRPEFINRIDEIVIFNSLGSEAIRRIAAIQLKSLQARVAAQDVTLEVTDEAMAELAEVGFDPHYGARPLKRAIQDHIENRLAMVMLEGSAGPGDTIRVGAKDGRFTFDVEKAAQ